MSKKIDSAKVETKEKVPAEAQPVEEQAQAETDLETKPKKKRLIDRFVESKFMAFLQRVGQKVGANKGVSSITAALMGTMGIIMVSAFFTIIANIPVSFKIGGLTSTSNYYKILIAPYNITMGLISVFLVTLIGYNFGRALKLKPLNTAIGSLVVFLLVAAPVTDYVTYLGMNEAGDAAVTGTLSALDSTYLGGSGMFLAICVALGVTGIFKFCDHFHIVIKMPDVVPQFLVDGFSSVIPLFFSVVLFYGVDVLFRYLTPGITLANLFTVIFKYGFGWLDSLPGIFFLSILCMLFWFFGIHGTMLVYVVIMASLTLAVKNNYMAHAYGIGEITFSYVFLFGCISCCGGSGNTLPLAIMCLCSKSKQLKAVGKAGIVPAVFGVNEPITFGVPMMYNPIMMIPFLFNPMITMVLVYIGYKINFFQIPYIMLGSLMPIGVNEVLGSLAWQNAFIPVVAFIVSGLMYFPFFKAYEKKLIAAEKVQEEAEAKEAEKAKEQPAA